MVLFEGTPNYGKANEARRRGARGASGRATLSAAAHAAASLPQLRLRDVFKGKKGILMAVPGAFTPGCSKARLRTRSHSKPPRGATP